MTRLIDADELHEIINWTSMKAPFSRKAVHRFIDMARTVEAEPVRHGHWKPFDEDEYTCSLCGNIFVTMDGEHPLSNEFKFCPNCGAKMDAEEKEE